MTWSTPQAGGYTAGDMERMQQDAVRRVREMQERSRRTVERTNPSVNRPENGERHTPPQAGSRSSPAAQAQQTRRQGVSSSHMGSPFGRGQNAARPQQMHTQPAASEHQPQSKSTGLGALFQGLGGLFNFGKDGPAGGILESLGIDDEKLILILLLLVLYKNDADKSLLLALGYVLLF